MLTNQRILSNKASDLREAIKDRARAPANIWHFESPKNKRRLVVSGDLTFGFLILAEGDVEVEGYSMNTKEIKWISGGEEFVHIPAVEVRYRDGRYEWWNFIDTRSSDRSSRREMAQAEVECGEQSGIYRYRTDKEFTRERVKFDNWLHLCAMINRCKHLFMEDEIRIVMQTLRSPGRHTLGSVTQIPCLDGARLLAAIAIALQKNIIVADLGKILSTETVLELR